MDKGQTNGRTFPTIPPKRGQVDRRANRSLTALLVHRTPLSYVLRSRSGGLFKSRPDTKYVPVHAFSYHKPIPGTISGFQISRKVVQEKLGATALRAPGGVRRGELRAGGRSAPSRGLVRGGVGSSSRLEYKRLAVAAALRTLPVIPNSRHFPTQNEPTGFPRRPRRAAVVISRRQKPARTSGGTNRRVHAAREGMASRFRLPSTFPPCMVHDSRTPQANSQPASRFTGPMPLL